MSQAEQLNFLQYMTGQDKGTMIMSDTFRSNAISLLCIGNHSMKLHLPEPRMLVSLELDRSDGSQKK